MSKHGGKGRISNDLVAVSCAAVLAVYGAGYWRTRDAARQFETQAKGRRGAVRSEAVALGPTPVVTHRSAPAPQQLPEVPPSIASAMPPSPAASTPVAVSKAISAPAPIPAPAALAAVATPSSSPAAPKTAHAHASSKPASGKAADAKSAMLAAAPKKMEKPVPATVGQAGSAPSVAASQTAPADNATNVVPPVTLAATPAPVSQPSPDPPATPVAKWKDGTYTGRGDSPHGNIEVRVVIKEGRIVQSAITECATRYPCDMISQIVPQPIARQSPEVDYISRATESSDAFYYGLVEALGKALDQPPGKATASQ